MARRRVKNQTGLNLRDAIAEATRLAGLDLDPKSPDGCIAYLKHMAIVQPVSFLALIGRVLPLQVNSVTQQDLNVTFRTVFEERPDDEIVEEITIKPRELPKLNS